MVKLVVEVQGDIVSAHLIQLAQAILIKLQLELVEHNQVQRVQGVHPRVEVLLLLIHAALAEVHPMNQPGVALEEVPEDQEYLVVLEVEEEKKLLLRKVVETYLRSVLLKEILEVPRH